MDVSFLLFALIIWFSKDVTCDEAADTGGGLEVTISRGAHINPIPDVILFTEREDLVFVIPDLPEPTSVTEAGCSMHDSKACALFSGLQKGIHDISDVLVVANRILTTKGLESVLWSDIEVPASWLKIIEGVNVHSNQPPPEIIAEAGQEWYSDTEAQLLLRKLVAPSPKPELNQREKRWVHQVITAGVKLAKLAAKGNVHQLFKRLFVGDNSILSYLTSYKVLSPDDFKEFAQLPTRISELQKETRMLLLDVLNSTELVKETTKALQEQMDKHVFKLATVEAAFLMEQNTVSDIIRLLYTTIVYSIHFSAYEECRARQVPIAFVPPNLLQQRLLDVEKGLPDNIRFAIPLEDFQSYYKLPLSDCVFDSNGGIIKLSIPLVEKDTHYVAYEFRPLRFAHGDMTCAMESLSSFIVKDIRNNKIFSITDIDMDECHPKTTGICKVPHTTAEDANNFCVSALLEGQSAAFIRETCELECVPDKKPSITQIADDLFLGIHLPKNDVKLECPGETLTLDSEVMHGAVRFQTVCGCKILLGTKTLEKSSTNLCDDGQVPKIDSILPVQMTTLNDLLPFTSAGHDITVFSHEDEILNKDFEPIQMEPPRIHEWIYRIVNIVVDLSQTIFITYLWHRLNGVVPTVLAAGGVNMPLVQAFKSHTCALPTDIYILLYIILVVSCLNIVPKICRYVYRIFLNSYNERVQMAAHQRVRELQE